MNLSGSGMISFYECVQVLIDPPQLGSEVGAEAASASGSSASDRAGFQQEDSLLAELENKARRLGRGEIGGSVVAPDAPDSVSQNVHVVGERPRYRATESVLHLCAVPAATTATGIQQNLKVVLQAMLVQAHLDANVERQKAQMPPGLSLQLIFAILDKSDKRHVSDSDIWQYLHDAGTPVSFGGVVTLIREVQQSRPADQHATPGRLALRELGEALLPKFGEKHRGLRDTKSDEEARSLLYVISFTEPCPSCGARVQRDSEAGMCAMVVCPRAACKTRFRCLTTLGGLADTAEVVDVNFLGVVDRYTMKERLDRSLAAIPASARWQLCRLLVTAVEAAEETERLRKGLSLGTCSSVGCLLTDAFAMLSQGRQWFAHVDLRRCLANSEIQPSPNESRLMWYRYAGESSEVSFAEFSKQLRPFAMRV